MPKVDDEDESKVIEIEVLGPEDSSAVEVPVVQKADMDEDYDLVRQNVKNLIGMGADALEGILTLAQESDHPRAYEVVGQIMKAQSDLNQQLITLQKDMKKLKEVDGRTGTGTHIENAVFVGSTLDLQRMLKGVSKEMPKDESD